MLPAGSSCDSLSSRFHSIPLRVQKILLGHPQHSRPALHTEPFLTVLILVEALRPARAEIVLPTRNTFSHRNPASLGVGIDAGNSTESFHVDLQGVGQGLDKPLRGQGSERYTAELLLKGLQLLLPPEFPTLAAELEMSGLLEEILLIRWADQPARAGGDRLHQVGDVRWWHQSSVHGALLWCFIQHAEHVDTVELRLLGWVPVVGFTVQSPPLRRVIPRVTKAPLVA
mmetsp:Transcript_10044/g.22141  ORF Transcript_10044/g.22141 Transcript_10044/m.22141 type:complete len:228 (-) Transcript_10044:585-1268(-)